MGSFQRDRQYKQQNPMGGAGALLGMLKEQNSQYKSIGDIVENQGQATARGKVAELMADNKFKGANPEQAQALVQELTGGRQLGDRGTQMLEQAYGDKQRALDNTNKMNAAMLLNQRQLARDSINNRESMSRVTAGKDTPVGELLTPAQIAEKKEQVRQYDEAMKSADVKGNDALKSRLRQERDTLAGEMVYGSTKKPSNAAVGAVTGIDKDGNFVGGSDAPKGKKISTPKALSGITTNSSKAENDLINKAYNQSLIKPLPREYYQKNDKEVKSGKKQVGDAKYSEDAMIKYKGQWIRKNRAQIVQYLQTL